MVKRTHGEKRHTIRGMGLARRKQKPCKRSVLRKSCTFIEIFFKNRLTKSRRDGKIYRQSAVAVKIESGRVPEWPMGTDCKSAAFQLRWFESTRAHQKSFNVTTTLELFVLCARETHECGWIRTAAATSQKTAQKQPGSRNPPAPTHLTAPVCKHTGAVLFLSAHGAAACSTSSKLRKTENLSQTYHKKITNGLFPLKKIVK